MEKKDAKNIHEISVKIEGEDWTKACDQVFLKKQKTVKVDGFRKGKVPRNVYEKRFGKESLYLDAANLVIPKAYDKAIKDSKLEPVVQPSVDIKNITKTEITIKKYKGLNIKPKKVKVTAEEVKHEIGHLLEKYTELVTKENGTVADGDIAIIDFEVLKMV